MWERGYLEGFGRKKGKGESDAILFYLKCIKNKEPSKTKPKMTCIIYLSNNFIVSCKLMLQLFSNTEMIKNNL